MAQVLFDAVAGGRPPWDDLYVAAPLSDLPPIDGILFLAAFRNTFMAARLVPLGIWAPIWEEKSKRKPQSAAFKSSMLMRAFAPR